MSHVREERTVLTLKNRGFRSAIALGQYAERLANASVEFHRLRQRHPGIESAIGALQAGNGLKRCRDHSEVGFERYLGLAILGRNIHVFGKRLIARRQAQAATGYSKRKAA